jgi:uncharacterized protein YjbI with pentapeptide repeats
MPGYLQHLKSLASNNIKINSANLENLLKAAPNLERISLFKSHFSGELLLAPKSHLHIKTIDISGCDINLNIIQNLLLAAPNVEELNLEDKILLSADLFLAPESLIFLKKLKLNQSNFTYHNLQKLLAASPNLIELDLSDCNDIFSKDWINIPPLLHLESFISKDNQISSSHLQMILAKATQLKKIHLIDDNLSDDIDLQPNSLPELEVLNLDKSVIKNSSLQSLLAAAPNLKKLILSPFINMTLTDVNLSKLEFISFSFQYDSNLFDIQKVFAEALNLKKFTLIGFQFPVGGISIKENSLPCLEEIDLSYSTFTVADLKKMIFCHF